MPCLFTREKEPLVSRAASLQEHAIRNRFLNADERIDQHRRVAVVAQHLGRVSHDWLEGLPGSVGDVFSARAIDPLFILKVILQRGCIDATARADVTAGGALRTMLA